MKVVDNILYADEGKTLRRKEDKFMVGESIYLGFTNYIGGKRVDPPHQDTPEDFEEVSPEDLYNERKKLYPETVEKYIRELYSLSDELAIQRQREEKPEAFLNYFNFCEDCKRRAKEYLQL